MHSLVLKDDSRNTILCSNFGYLFGGSLVVNVSGISHDLLDQIGFTLIKLPNSIIKAYEYSNKKCILEYESTNELDKRFSLVLLNHEGIKIIHDESKGVQINAVPVSEDHFFISSSTPNDRIEQFRQPFFNFLTYNTEKYSEEDIKATVQQLLDLLSLDKSTVSSLSMPLTVSRILRGLTRGDTSLTRVRRAVPEAGVNSSAPIISAPDNSTPAGGVDTIKATPGESHAGGPKLADPVMTEGTVSRRGNKTTPNREAIINASQSQQQKAVIENEQIVEQLQSLGDTKKLSDSVAQTGVHLSGQAKDIVQQALKTNENRLFQIDTKTKQISFSFKVDFVMEVSAGAYDLYFHKCSKKPISITISMMEKNLGNYLSAGEQLLSSMYSFFGLVYMVLSFVWFFYLKYSKASVFRIHYLMLALIFMKSVSLGFLAINYYVIGKQGIHEEGWAVMYYITHMTRGFLFFITILMIGAGWNFIKHVFTPREKNVFIIVIPLQILANIAFIVIQESEQGSSRFVTWNEILTLVDLICCAIILFPVIWSIRHLQTASQTDGKAANSLRKLRLFRHFYIMIICCIYFTRIITYFLSLTMPFQYSWVAQLFEECVTLIFLVSVGFRFRPFTDNPYLQLPTDDLEDSLLERYELEEVLSQSGRVDGVVRLQRSSGNNLLLNSSRSRQNRHPSDDPSGVEVNEHSNLIID